MTAAIAEPAIGQTVHFGDQLAATPQVFQEVRTYRIVGAPDIRDNYQKRHSVLRPMTIEVHLENRLVTSVIIRGLAVRRDDTLGRDRSMFYGRHHDETNPDPKWLHGFLTLAGLTWPSRGIFAPHRDDPR